MRYLFLEEGMDVKECRYNEFRSQIKNADVLLYEGSGWFSKLIQI